MARKPGDWRLLRQSSGSSMQKGNPVTKPSFVDDHAAITALLGQYIESGRQGRSAIMQPAFTADATIFGIRDGQLAGGPITDFFAIVDQAGPSPAARAAIASIDIVGTAASARVDTNDIAGFCFTDFFNLLKVDGRWLIVSKIYHAHQMPPTAAS